MTKTEIRGTVNTHKHTYEMKSNTCEAGTSNGIGDIAPQVSKHTHTRAHTQVRKNGISGAARGLPSGTESWSDLHLQRVKVSLVVL